MPGLSPVAVDSEQGVRLVRPVADPPVTVRESRTMSPDELASNVGELVKRLNERHVERTRAAGEARAARMHDRTARLFREIAGL